MAELTAATDTPNGVLGVSGLKNQAKLPRRFSPMTSTLVLAVAFGCVYVAFQRIGTTANADVVEFTRNLAGGFLAVGMTDDTPGFVVLSTLDNKDVAVRAEQSSNRFAGTHTILRVTTPKMDWYKRLRGPMVVTVATDGTIESLPVDWSVAEFRAVRERVDCSHLSDKTVRRCGAPFVDLHDMFVLWEAQRVPLQVRAFLADILRTSKRS